MKDTAYEWIRRMDQGKDGRQFSGAALRDMEADPGEQKNLYESHPEVFERLLAQLESDVNRGRGTAGPDQKNDAKNINTKRGAGVPTLIPIYRLRSKANRSSI